MGGRIITITNKGYDYIREQETFYTLAVPNFEATIKINSKSVADYLMGIGYKLVSVSP